MAGPALRLDPPLVTIDEFLRFEGEPELRYELMDGRIVREGGPEIALELEEKGYEHIREEVLGNAS